MAHESTVSHEQHFVADTQAFSRSRQTSMIDGNHDNFDGAANINLVKV